MLIKGMEVDEKTMIMSENPIQSPSAEYLSVAKTAKPVRTTDTELLRGPQPC